LTVAAGDPRTNATERQSLVADFDYELPDELIAQRPLAQRDASRLLVLGRASGAVQHSLIANLPGLLKPGDLLVANNSRVIPARLHGRRLPSGGAVEVLLLRREGNSWSALARPAKRLGEGTVLEFPSRLDPMRVAKAVISGNLGGGELRIVFLAGADEHLAEYGETPLPPYIKERLADAERYQTVYATAPGSAAAPTAGLHFTPHLRSNLAAAGVDWAELTLHVGLDTFRPVTVERVTDHIIHQEWYEVSEEAVTRIVACRERGGRVIAIGTTAARTIEALGQSWEHSAPHGGSGFTDIFITPGYRWRLVDGLVTNFHLPRSTLLMMVSALAGRERVLAAYEEAKSERYRFFSFGDAMLIL
jgi:S-adenosylmethionine:tRNA ribosyltransferase-isomerase